MKFLITGGYGFIGSSVIRHILTNTNHSVINIDALTYAGNQDSIPSALKKERYEFEHINIRNSLAIENILKNHQPNTIMHLAAESHVDRSIDSPEKFLETNILGTFTLLEEARKYFNNLSSSQKKKFKFHHISTDEVFGDLDSTEKYFTESTSYAPSSPYAASKASADHLVKAWGRTYGLPVIITNCSNNYGPYHFPEKLIPHVILNAIHGKPIPVYGAGQQIRDWLYVEDHARALLKVVTEGEIGETYNIGGHNEKTNLEVIESICGLLEKIVPQKPSGVKNYLDLITFVKDRPGHDIRYAIDASKIEQELCWVPKETFESGLRKTVQWYVDNPDWWGRVLSGDYRLERLGG